MNVTTVAQETKTLSDVLSPAEKKLIADALTSLGYEYRQEDIDSVILFYGSEHYLINITGGYSFWINRVELKAQVQEEILKMNRADQHEYELTTCPICEGTGLNLHTQEECASCHPDHPGYVEYKAVVGTEFDLGDEKVFPFLEAYLKSGSEEDEGMWICGGSIFAYEMEEF